MDHSKVSVLACLWLALGPGLACAQTRPASSGASSFAEPEMRRKRSGMYRPNHPRNRLYHYRYKNLPH